MFTWMQESQGDIVALRASGRLTHTDYEEFTAEMERRMRQYGAVRVLLDLEDFHGWDFDAAWADFTFGLKHLGRLERCAVVGDKKWEEWLTALGKPFFKVRYFDRFEEAAAWDWLRQPHEEGAPSWPARLSELTARHPLASIAGAVAVGFVLWYAMGRPLSVR
jgi:hypothetical protein